MEQPSESDPQFIHFQHGCPTLSREEQVVLFHALRNQGMTFAPNGTVTITNSVIHGPVAGINFGTMQSIIQMLPEPIDPLPAALAALASIPLNDVPTPRSDLPQSSRLPFESSPHFVGREIELKALAQAIGTAQPAVVMPAVATGLGGIGKTSLVTEFAYRYGWYFHGGVFWLNCADPDQVASQIAACAVGLKLDTAGLSLDEQVQRVLHAWKSPMPRLLIFDNCENPAILEQWKPTVGGCRVLVTARSVDWPPLTQIRLGLLPPTESRLLLQRLCVRLTDTEADTIATDLGHLPLALHLAGSYLATYSHHTVDQYRKDLTIAHQSLKGRGALPSPTRHELDVEATFMLSFNQLDPSNALDSLALGMLDGAAWCAPGVPIPLDLVLAFVPDGTDADDAVDALRRLQQLGLLDGSDTVVLHRLLNQCVSTQSSKTGLQPLRLMLTRLMGIQSSLTPIQQHVEQIVSKAAWLANKTGLPHAMKHIEPHLRYLTVRALKRQDEISTRLANNLGFFEDLCGSYCIAQEYYEQVLVIREKIFGFKHLDTATSINNLASVLAKQGVYPKAQGLYEQALAIREAILGVDHPDTIISMNNLASVLAKQGLYPKAQGLYEQALAIREAILGVDHPDTIISMNNLVTTLLRQGEYSAARILLDRLLESEKIVLDIATSDMVENIDNLAFILMIRGKYKKAQKLYERGLEIYKHIFGTDHPYTASGMNNLAVILVKQGRYSDAKSLYENALMIRKSLLGVNHPDTLTSMRNLTGVVELQRIYEEKQDLGEYNMKYEDLLGQTIQKDLQSIKIPIEDFNCMTNVASSNMVIYYQENSVIYCKNNSKIIKLIKSIYIICRKFLRKYIK